MNLHSPHPYTSSFYEQICFVCTSFFKVTLWCRIIPVSGSLIESQLGHFEEPPVLALQIQTNPSILRTHWCLACASSTSSNGRARQRTSKVRSWPPGIAIELLDLTTLTTCFPGGPCMDISNGKLTPFLHQKRPLDITHLNRNGLSGPSFETH